MADPLLTPALVGTAVNLFFTEVIGAAKNAYQYKEKCRILLESVTKLQPHIDSATRYSANWDEAQSNGLEEIKDLLDKARSCATKGMKESKAEKRKRAMAFWRWGKLPAELLDIVHRIEKAQQTVVFVAALETLTYVNALKKTESSDFVAQQIPSDIVGVDVPFNRLKASILASCAKDKPSHLGLHGRGGAGKTLLAQMLHNDKDIIHKFGAHSILWITVGLDARVSDLYKTMGLLLTDGVFEEKYAHRSLKDQRGYLWNAFAQKQVLLILDDVWQERCEGNHEMMYWLNIATAPGSVTLITTRSTSVLSRIHAESEVVLALSEEDSWELFCSHAFYNGTLPSTVSQELANEVCQECKGLPLALKVIGSAMVDKGSEAEWSSALHDLKQSEPILDSMVDYELFGRLRLSYDELKGDVLKTCFLYFAAFPEDYEIPTSKLFSAWISEGLFGSVDAQDAENKALVHLEMLEKRSLIHWDRDEDYVKVHDILRDLALYIIDKAKAGDCAYEGFFHSGKVLKSFPSRKSFEVVKRMSFVNSTICEWPENLQAPHLEVCLLSGVSKPEELISKNLSGLTNLKYLDLSRCQFDYVAMVLILKRLVSLTSLDLSHCNFLKEIPVSIGKLKCLIHLDLSWCESLKELPMTMGELKCLTHLNLNGCNALKELPVSIVELKCLMHFDLGQCIALEELPVRIGDLKCLTHINLKGCKSLKELPVSMGELKCLTHLDLSFWESLKELSVSIGKLKCLKHLYLEGCESLKELPVSISELKCLAHLYLKGCTSLKELPLSIGELKCLSYLDLEGCVSLKELPVSISELKCLTHLYLEGCESLKELPMSIGKLKCLMYLDLQGWESLKELPVSIGELKCLSYLDIEGCVSLKELPMSIGDLKCLMDLDLKGCESLKELPLSIGELKCLMDLDLKGCESLKELPLSIGKLKCLTYLYLEGCKSLKELPVSISELKCLAHLYLKGCKALKELPLSIGELKCLSYLHLEGCVSLKELPVSISELKCLMYLDLKGCESLKELPVSIGELKCLKYLDLSMCAFMSEDLPASISQIEALIIIR